LGGVKVPVACAEDVIVMKILGGRPKDLDDVSAILAAKRHDLDLELVKDTLRLIEQALDRSDLVSELERIAAQPLG
jgi:DNA-directed RNA polymerase subunit F